MTYNVIVTNAGDWLWDVKVFVSDDAGNVVLTGETTVACEDEQTAHDYGEHVFLPDLRRNYPREIGDLVFPWEVTEDDQPSA